MESEASADHLGFFTSSMTNGGIWSEGWKTEGKQQSALRFVAGEFQGKYSLWSNHVLSLSSGSFSWAKRTFYFLVTVPSGILC